MKNTKNTMKKGFTLVELLFVMAIISILAGIGISQMSGSTEAANKVVLKSDIRSAITAAQIQYANGGTYDGSSFTSTNSEVAVTYPVATTLSFCVEATMDEVGTFSYDSSNSAGIVEASCS